MRKIQRIKHKRMEIMSNEIINNFLDNKYILIISFEKIFDMKFRIFLQNIEIKKKYKIVRSIRKLILNKLKLKYLDSAIHICIAQSNLSLYSLFKIFEKIKLNYEKFRVIGLIYEQCLINVYNKKDEINYLSNNFQINNKLIIMLFNKTLYNINIIINLFIINKLIII